MKPCQRQGDGKADRECQQRKLLDDGGPGKGVGGEAHDLQHHPRARRVREPPLHHLAAAQLDPWASGLALYPSSDSVAASAGQSAVSRFAVQIER